MAYINLRERVRFFPTLTKKDLPLNFDKKYVTTIIFDGYSASGDIGNRMYVPKKYADWSGMDNNYCNYINIVGQRDEDGVGTGIISDLDYNFFALGCEAGAITTFLNKSFTLYYNNEVNPETNQHSGYMYYDIYNLTPSPILASGSNSSSIFYISVDVYESEIAPNNAISYDQIQ